MRALAIVLAFPVTVVAFITADATPVPGATSISRRSVESRGERRTYYVLAPAEAEPRPFVLLLHGTGGTGRELVERWSALGEEPRPILAAPSSLDTIGWRIPRDGTDLFRDVVEAVAASRPVDRRRIYLVGYSAGGDAALFSSLAQSRYFAASAVLAAALRPRQYPLIDLAERRIPLMLVAGDRDSVYPPAEVRGTREAFEARGFPLEYVELQGRDHRYVGGSEDVVRRTWRFLRQHRLDEDAVYRRLDERLTSFARR
jgi:poly(3-hydroxybutyrate) depolymerase